MSSEVLPEPDGPMIAQSSPPPRPPSMPLRISLGPFFVFTLYLTPSHSNFAYASFIVQSEPRRLIEPEDGRETASAVVGVPASSSTCDSAALAGLHMI